MCHNTMVASVWLAIGAAVVARIGAGPMLRPVLRYQSGGVHPVIGSPDGNAFLPGYGFEVRACQGTKFLRCACARVRDCCVCVCGGGLCRCW